MNQKTKNAITEIYNIVINNIPREYLTNATNQLMIIEEALEKK
jgi:hypothetical protein